MALKDEQPVKPDGIQPVLEARAFAYDLLRRTFLEEPSREYVQSLAGSGAVLAFPFRDESPAIGAGVEEVAAHLGDPANLTTDAYEDLHWDYTRMFIGPATLPAPPWESAYQGEERLLFQQETLAVRKVYHQYGLLSQSSHHEAEDHLGLELDFLFQLTQFASDRVAAGDGAGLVAILQDQQAFLDQHLLRWVPRFSSDVIASAETAFYKGFARILQGYLEIDRQLLDELIKVLQADT